MTTTLFPAFRTADAARFAAFLVAAGFTERLTVPGDAPGLVAHAEYAHGDRGGLMFGSSRGADDPLDRTIGTQGLYVVEPDPDTLAAVWDRLRTHPGVEVLAEPSDPRGDGAEFGVADPDGNQWWFGVHAGQAASGPTTVGSDAR